MPLKTPQPARWPWKTTVAWVGFDLLDEMAFNPFNPDFPGRVGMTLGNCIIRCRVAIDEISRDVAEKRVTAYWKKPSTSEQSIIKRRILLDNEHHLSRSMKEIIDSRLARFSYPLDWLEFDRSEVLSNWPPSSGTGSHSAEMLVPIHEDERLSVGHIHPTTEKSRGPRPKKREAIKEEMRKLPLDILENMGEKEMEEKFQASRDTCRKARTEVVSEFVDRHSATNDK